MPEYVAPHVLLLIAIVCGVAQATLDRAGVGRIENLPNGAALLALSAIIIPATLLSNLGLIAIVIWSLVKLRLVPTLVVLAIGFIGWSIVWSFALYKVRRSSAWPSVVAVGIPLVLAVKVTTAACVLLLGWQLARGGHVW